MLTYRPDIDGLRAIAVLSVLAFHLDEHLLTGGFVGVDVFFVISGYLITNLIHKELQAGQGFSFKRFYLRRVRRLFPALFATLGLSVIAAGSLLSPAHLIEFGQSAVAAVLSLSNIYFWNAADYFDSQSQLKPLLHTWSLSVEEQFYFIWPALMVLLFGLGRRWLLPAFVVVMGLLSLALNLWVFSNQAEIASWFGESNNQSTFSAATTAFYWLPFRVFEFAIGAILVWLPQASKLNRRGLAEVCFLVGLGMVIYAITQLTSKTEFPSTAALWPCIGAGLMIFSGPHHRLSWLVSNRLAVGVGLISYSLYLLHWPLIVFFRYRNFEPPTTSDQILIAVVSIILAVLFYKFIEQPFRKPAQGANASNRPFLTAAAFAALAMIAVNAHAAWSGGWLSRYPAAVVAQLSYKKGDYTEYFWHNLKRLETGFSDSGKPKVLVIGDSMAADFVNVLIEGGTEDDFDLATIPIGDNCKAAFPLTDKQYLALFGGAGDICRRQHDKVLNNVELLKQADTIVLASFWWEFHWAKYVRSSVAWLNQNTDAKIMVLGLKNQNSDGIWFLNKHSLSPNIHKIRTPMNSHAAGLNHALRARQEGYTYFDLLDLFCNAEGCQRVTKQGYVIVFDQAHLSENGARFIGQQIRGTSWFKQLQQPKP